ncbi:MAG: PA14 domain-containing protein, partial [Chloroflexota bacterium]
MFKRIFFLLNVLLFLLVTFPVLTQTRAGQPAETPWLATYWNNLTLSGPPALQRQEPTLAFNWGSDSPAPAVWPDHFSARWTRYINFTAGAYRFTTTADDGLRLWLDDQSLIDDWSDHAAHTLTIERNVTAGPHLLTVEYYEKDGQAAASVKWELLPITDWRGEYFNNPWLEGNPALVRNDLAVDFNWGSDAPAPGIIGADGFAARWTRTLDLPAGHYRFTATADDGFRLWVNGRLLIYAWQIQAATTHTADLDLPGGPVELRAEYYENSGLAAVRLTWATVEQTTPPPTAIIVDDSDPNFVRGG